MPNLMYGTLSTAQFSYRGADRLDITLKSYMKWFGWMGPGCFYVPCRSLEDPNYELVGGLKHHQLWMADEITRDSWQRKYPRINEDEYKARYLEILRGRYRHNPDQMLAAIMLPGLLFAREETTLVCYCKAGTFCHRHIAKEVMGQIAMRHGIVMLNGGERELLRPVVAAGVGAPLPLVVEHLV